MLPRLLLICLAVLIVAQTRVYAYADPGSGTLIWQMLLAAAFGLVFYLRRIMAWFRSRSPDREKDKSVDPRAAETERDSNSVDGEVV